MKHFFRPFEEIGQKSYTMIVVFWVMSVLAFWFISSLGERHLFPSPQQVVTGFSELYNEGLVVHVFSSLWLCLKAIIIAVVITFFR